ncbi:hypothetical protein Emed_005552 [Eimeria media]
MECYPQQELLQEQQLLRDKQQQQQQQQQQQAEGCCGCSSSAPVSSEGCCPPPPVRRGRCCCCTCCCCSSCCCSSSSSKGVCSSMSLPAEALSSKVLLNVGGKVYATTPSTLSNYGPHYLSRRMSPPWVGGETREIFLDRNGEVFGYVLDFLRNGVLCCSNEPWLLQQLLLEARFLCIKQLAEEVLSRLHGAKALAVASRFEFADKAEAATALGIARSHEVSAQSRGPHSASMNLLLQQQQQQDSLQQQQQQQPPILQQLQRLHLSGSAASNSQEVPLLSHGSRESGSSSSRSDSSSSSNRSRSSGGQHEGITSTEGSSSEAHATAAAAAPAAAAGAAAESPQERTKLAQIAAAAELAARAESLRRSLVNDDPEPPEPHPIKDLGDRVLLTDEDF